MWWWLNRAGFPRPKELRALAQVQADVAVRVGWNALRLPRPEGGPFDPVATLRALKEAPAERRVVVDDGCPDQPPPSARLIIARKPEDAAGKARRKLRQNARKRGKTPDPDRWRPPASSSS